jgi:hypothetical protein
VLRQRVFVLAPTCLPHDPTPGEEAYQGAREAVLKAVG